MSLALVTFLFVCLGIAPAIGSAETNADVSGEADRIHIDIRVDESGDAIWRVSYRIPLETDEDRTAFDDLATDIESDPSPYIDRYEGRMSDAAASAEAATGREMAVEDMTVRTTTDELPEPTGIVEYEFRWTNFAAEDGDTLVVGDAIEGMFLDEETSLLIGGPDGWVIESVSPEPTDDRTDAAVWRGAYEFSSGEPRVTFAEERGSIWATIGFVPLLGGAMLITLLLIGGWVGLRYRTLEPSPETPTETADPEIDRELLSNAEQVIMVLENHGGRMKQKELAEELDWTAAKTSQVTTDLREEGRIEGFRLGRENVLKLPDAEE